MYVQQPIMDGDCIDNAYIGQLFSNIEFFRKCAQTDRERFSCIAINEEKNGNVRRTDRELCFDLQTFTETVNPVSGDDSVKKMMFLTLDTSSQSNQSDGDNITVLGVRRVARLLCDGVEIRTFDERDLARDIIISRFDCPENATLQLCFDSRWNYRGQGFLTGVQTIRICGALTCIKDVSAEQVSGLFQPPTFKDFCCYGREAIHLALQNIAALRLEFEEFGQVPNCRNETFNDDEAHVLINTAESEVSFLILGEVTVCGRNHSTVAQASIDINPVFTCGGRTITCLTDSRTIPAGINGQIVRRCLTVPIAICGVCEKGDSLVSAVRAQITCDERVSQTVDGFGSALEGHEQHYCMFLYEGLVTDFGDDLNASLGKCIDLSVLNSISDSLDDINVVCENQTPIQLSNRDFSVLLNGGQCAELVPAGVAPPFPEDPKKKWFLEATITPSYRGGINNIERKNGARAIVELYCDGGLLMERRVVSWQVSSSGSVSRGGPTIRISRCYECNIADNINICVFGEQNGGFGTIPDDFDVDIKLVTL